ncbi:hypothetical protein MBLNU457_2141t2 [Dothideomycetes sp. NU457]
MASNQLISQTLDNIATSLLDLRQLIPDEQTAQHEILDTIAISLSDLRTLLHNDPPSQATTPTAPVTRPKEDDNELMDDSETVDWFTSEGESDEDELSVDTWDSTSSPPSRLQNAARGQKSSLSKRRRLWDRRRSRSRSFDLLEHWRKLGDDGD